MDSPEAPRAEFRQLVGVRIEVDVTPRWFAPGASFIDDTIAIVGALRDSPILAGVEDVQVGLAGVRLTLIAPAGASLSEIEGERDAFRALLDQLDLVSPRRRRVTEQREASRVVRRLVALPKPAEGAETRPGPENGGKGPPEGTDGPSPLLDYSGRGDDEVTPASSDF